MAINCRRIHDQIPEGSDRVYAMVIAAPNCICEQQKISQFSPGTVANNEIITRFVFKKIDGSKFHIGKDGKILPSAFSYVLSKGFSVQREDKATDKELTYFLKGKYLPAIPDQAWHGIIQANCVDIRGLRLDHNNQQLFCVYDTAEADNVSHAEVFAACVLGDEGEQLEAKKRIRDLFSANGIVAPENYRNGAVLSGTPEVHIHIIQKPSLIHRFCSLYTKICKQFSDLFYQSS